MDDGYELAPCGLVTTQTDGLITRSNERMTAWLGFTAEELQTKKFQDLLTIGSKLFHHTQWRPLLQLQGSVAEVQLELVTKNGRKVPALINASLRNRAADATSVIDIAVFIATDRRQYERELLHARKNAERMLAVSIEAEDARAQAEAQLRLALDSAGLGIWDYDFEAQRRRYEANVGALVGVEVGAAVSADLYEACIHPDDREAERAAFSALLAGSEDSRYAAEYRLVGRDGVERVVHATARAFANASGVIVRLSGVLQDVTLLRREERDAHNRAVLAEQLIGIVSHDLRNPLNVVRLGADALGQTAEGLEKRVVDRIVAATQRANRLIGDLLDFTQARLGGGLRVTLRRVDLHAIVGECIEEVKQAWPTRQIVHHREGTGDGLVDPDRIAQVVSNLANNAFVYGTPATPVVITSVVTEDSFEILVHNEGAPIPEEAQRRIFEPMQRGEQQSNKESRSVGLGLYIVQQIVSSHRGQISVRSATGIGTTFDVRVPRRQAEATDP